MATGSCKGRYMVRYTAVDGENCMPTLIFSLCAWTGKGHVFRDQKERIKKKKRSHLPGAKRGDKKGKTNGNRNKLVNK
jgi:hypothetical protein